MGRPEGSPNKQKTVAEVLKMLKAAAEKEGVEFNEENIRRALESAPIAPVDGEDEALAAAEKLAANNAKLKKFADLNITLDADEEVDTYKCGNCGEIMASAMANCPACDAKLKW